MPGATAACREASCKAKEATIALAGLAGIEYHGGLLTGPLVLVGTRLAPFGDTRHGWPLDLRIERRNGAEARRTAWILQAALENRRLRHLRKERE